MSTSSSIRLENYDISLNDLAVAVGSQWQNLGNELKINESQLEAIGNETKSDSARALEMLQLWKNSNQYNDFDLQQALINISFDFLKFVSAKQESHQEEISSDGRYLFYRDYIFGCRFPGPNLRFQSESI